MSSDRIHFEYFIRILAADQQIAIWGENDTIRPNRRVRGNGRPPKLLRLMSVPTEKVWVERL